MNKEFVYINDETVAVSDEDGKITIRKNQGDMRDVLVSEDKMKILNERIKSSRDGIALEKASIKIIDKWYKVMAGVSVGVLIAAPITLGLLSGLTLFLGWSTVALLSCAYGRHVQKDSVKRIKGYKSEIKRAIDLKQEVRHDLDFYKEMEKEFGIPKAKVGEVVQVNPYEEIDVQENSLRRAFKKGYREKPKVLVKTKENVRKN